MKNLDSFTRAYIECALWSSTEYKHGECPCCGRVALLNSFPEPEFNQDAMCNAPGCGVREIPNPPPMDQNYGPEDLSPDALEKIQKDCTAFQDRAGDLISSDNLEKSGDAWTQAAHDFWLTRNGHGAGFWDGDWTDEAGDKLTAIANEFGTCDLYAGDDGKLYVS